MTEVRNWKEMGRIARAACEREENYRNRHSPGHYQIPASVALDAQTAYNLWTPAIWVLAAETIEQLRAELAAFEQVDIWDSPDYEQHVGVYYEDERRPDDAVPLYRKVPVKVVGGVAR